MIFEGATHIWREIYMDGRKFPEGDALNPTYLGYSVGRWENPDTLVVENKGFNENSWLDYFGHPHTDLMEVVRALDAAEQADAPLRGDGERSGRVHPGRSRWRGTFRGNADGELPEYICQENNQYLNRLEDDLGQPIFGARQQPGQRPPGGTR